MDISKKLVRMKISDLIPYENNPRKIPEEAVADVCESYRQCGVIDPIEVDEDNVILAGHTRRMAAIQIGLTSVDVLKVTGLTDEQKRKYRILANKTGERSAWDYDLLAAEIDELDFGDYDFDFEIPELNKSFSADELEEADDYEPNVPDEPKAKRGQIYQLGNHRLMCGDSTSAECIEELLNGEHIDIVLQDPPYGVNIVQDAKVGGDKPFGRTRSDAGGVVRLGATRGEAKNAILKAKLYMPIKGDDTTETARLNYEIVKELSDIQIIFGGNYFTDFLPPSRCWIVWDKGVPKEAFFAAAELAWCSKDANTELYHHLWSGICREGDRNVEGKTRLHPTQKPVGLLANILQDFSKADDNVLDCFGGSGSTLIACEQTGRNCYMIEYEPHYVDVIIDRWEQFTGKQAVLLNG